MLTQERLKEVLFYEPETGIFRWRVNYGHAASGSVAGNVNNHGHRRIKIDFKHYYAHRLAWLYVHGTWPADKIDHINNDHDDNRLVNLREASQSQNGANCGAYRSNKLGIKGVHMAPNGRYIAQIRTSGKRRCLGRFSTAEEASQAYQAAAREAFGEFARFDARQTP